MSMAHLNGDRQALTSRHGEPLSTPPLTNRSLSRQSSNRQAAFATGARIDLEWP